METVTGVLACPTINTLDLQHNSIADPAVLEVLVRLPNLAVLYLQGNPCVKQTPHYRRTYIARIPTLRFLDDRPVFDDERQRAEAFYAVVAEGACLVMLPAWRCAPTRDLVLVHTPQEARQRKRGRRSGR